MYGQMPGEGGHRLIKWKRFELRLSEGELAAVRRTARDRGFPSVSAYVQAALVSDRKKSPEETDRDAMIAASMERLSKEVRTVHTAQQALFAAVDSLARLFLTCIPEPPPEALEQAKRRARLRYDKFLLAVAQNMGSDSRATLTELIERE
jgi:hypothetical protein